MSKKETKCVCPACNYAFSVGDLFALSYASTSWTMIITDVKHVNYGCVVVYHSGRSNTVTWHPDDLWKYLAFYAAKQQA